MYDGVDNGDSDDDDDDDDDCEKEVEKKTFLPDSKARVNFPSQKELCYTVGGATPYTLHKT